MKKITKLFAPAFAVAALLLVPVAAHAQVVDVQTPPATTPPLTAQETKEGSVPAVGKTGIAPAENRAAMNVAVFIGGSALGAALGLGAIALRKKNNN